MDFRCKLSDNSVSLSIVVLCAWMTVGICQAGAQTPPPKKAAPAPPKASAAPVKAAAPAAGATHATGTTTTAAHTSTTTTAAHTGASTTTAAHPTTTTTTASRTTTTTTTAKGTTSSTTATRTSTTTPTGTRPAAGAVGVGGRPGAGAGAAHGGVEGVRSGNLAHAGPIGSHDRVAPNGNAMRVRANGRPADFHDARRGMDVHNNLGGGRRVMMERHDGSRLYYERGRPGYIAHPYMYGGHEYARRTYYYNGRAYDRYYNHYGYRGVYLDVYAPVRYYGAGFYGWAYNPWAVPVAYAWGWGATPWYGYYGAYWTPYPVYATPSLWLTDYLIAQTLQAAFAAHQAASAEAAAVAGSAPPAPLTPETKAMIAEEVRRQVALENAEAQANAQHQGIDPASSGIARLLGDGQPHVFVAGKEVDVTDGASGQECAVTDGDVLQLKSPPALDATSANLIVLSSKGGVECQNMASVLVSLEDLQDMQNHMRETVDQGLAELQQKQGKGGLPAAPPSALTPPATAAVAENAPPPDPAVAQELAAQAQEADKAVQEVTSEVAAGGPSDTASPSSASAALPASASPPQVNLLGMSTTDVTAAMGQPSKILNLGPKVVYVYKDMKITFKAGKVSDVE